MIEPALSDDAFLADVRDGMRADDGSFRLWWLGQSGFLLQWNGRHLLMDPYLSDSLTAKYAGTTKPHVRMTRRVVDPARLDFIDVATSTHNHTDHLDAQTLGPVAAASAGAALVLPAANVAFARERLGRTSLQLTPMLAGQSATVAGFEFHALPAAHDALTTDDQGRHVYLGYVVRFGGWCVYHSGDTVVYPGMAELLRPHRIDVAILPINGRVGNMSGPDAAALAKAVDVRLALPCHFEMFEFNTAPPDAFVAAARGLGQRVRVLRAGERWSSGELAEAAT